MKRAVIKRCIGLKWELVCKSHSPFSRELKKLFLCDIIYKETFPKGERRFGI